jgi:TonB family protein
MRRPLLFFFIFFAHSLEAQTNQQDTLGRVYEEVPPRPLFDTKKYISDNVRYPKEAKRKGHEGRVVVQFTLDTAGKVTECSVLKGFDKDCDEEALRVVREMPGWTPGMQNGKPVKVVFKWPIVFRLDDPEPPKESEPKWRKK